MILRPSVIPTEQIDRIKNILSYFEDTQVAFHAPATGDVISQAQKILDLHFPLGLINYLFSTNGISVVSEDFLGLSNALYVPNMLDATLWAREKFKSFPAEYVVLFVDAFENPYCVNTAVVRQDECPVVYWDAQEQLTVGVYSSGVFRFIEMMSTLMTRMYSPAGEPMPVEKLQEVQGFEDFNWLKTHDPEIVHFRAE